MQSQTISLGSYNLHLIKIKRFKNCLIQINFRDNLTRDNYLKSILLIDLLLYSNAKYPKRSAMVRANEDLYLANIGGGVSNYGQSLILTINCDFIAPDYFNDQTYLQGVIDYLMDIIFNPNLEGQGFAKQAFDIIQKNLINDIKLMDESPSRIAFHNALNLFPVNSPYQIFLDNYEEDDILNITPEDIYDFYQLMLEHFSCDIIVGGRLDYNQVTQMIKNRVQLRTIKNHQLLLYVDAKPRLNLIKKRDQSNFQQSVILLYYNLVDLSAQERLYTIWIFDYIFSNGSFKSKLFKYLREDNSLCYGVTGLYQKFNKLYVIEVQLARDNVARALKIITQALQEMKKGQFTSEIVIEAKKNIINSIKSYHSYLFAYFNDLYLNEIDIFPDQNERMKQVRKITKADVVKISSKLKLQIQYVLEDGNQE